MRALFLPTCKTLAVSHYQSHDYVLSPSEPRLYTTYVSDLVLLALLALLAQLDVESSRRPSLSTPTVHGTMLWNHWLLPRVVSACDDAITRISIEGHNASMLRGGCLSPAGFYFL
ncbi:hypothetical protein ACMFMF_003928 [Clarireedia jacksonii]